MNLPKITIITPSFNQGQFIEETILSVLDQKYPNLEYIIVDGGSTDNSVEIIKKYEDKLAWWVSEKDKGQSDAINKGLEKATGEIFNWLNSDDVLTPGSLHHIATAFLEQKCNVYCGFTSFYDAKLIEKESSYRLWIGENPESSITNVVMNQPATFFKLDIIRHLEGVNPAMHYSMDLEMWWRYLAKYGIDEVYLSDFEVCKFRLHDESKTTTQGMRFNNEIFGLRIYLAEHFKLPEYYIQYLRKLQPQEWDYHPLKWEIKKDFDKKEYARVLLQEFLYNLYYQHNRKECKKYLRQYVAKNQGKLNLAMIKLVLKVIILPAGIDKFSQQVKGLIIKH